MSYTLTLACGCAVYVHEDVHRATAPVRTLRGRGDRCPTPRHAVGVRVWLWELLPDPPMVPPREENPASTGDVASN